MNYLTFLFDKFKYYIVVILVVLFLGFLGENTFMGYYKNREQIELLEEEIDKYNKIYQSDIKNLKELKTKPSTLIKIARERYYMKKENEDIFVLSDDE